MSKANIIGEHPLAEGLVRQYQQRGWGVDRSLGLSGRGRQWDELVLLPHDDAQGL